MREIKFRAWHTEKKVMYPPWSIWKTNLFDYEDSCFLHLMQYTGLKDRNGREIYEGDVLEYYGTKRGRMKPITVVEWLQNNKRAYHGYVLGNPINYEIIGNIHENPELLKGALK